MQKQDGCEQIKRLADLSRIAPALRIFVIAPIPRPKVLQSFFGIRILQNPHNGSSEMSSRQNEEGRLFCTISCHFSGKTCIDACKKYGRQKYAT